MEPNNENKQDVMVSNLPLLFSDGNPTNIDHMSAVMEKLECCSEYTLTKYILGGSTILCVISNEMHFGSGTSKLVKVS